jgi:hypothetical protein
VVDAHGPALLLLFEKAAPTQKPGGYGTGRQWRPLDQALAVLWQAGAWREELIQLLELLAERPLKQPQRRLHPLPWALPVPLRVHGHYTRAEIEAAFGVLSTVSPWIHREGVLWHQPSATDLLFITLRKSEALFSPSTRYRDLALGPSLFHWESQSTTTAASATGQRTIHHASRGSKVRLEREIPAAWLPGCCLALQRRWRFEGAVQLTSGRVLSHPTSLCLSPLVMATALAASSALASIPG